MNASAIRYTDSESMIHISKKYKLSCEYDGNKPDQIEIKELDVVLKKGNWLININDGFIVCNEDTRFALYGNVHTIRNMELEIKKRFGARVTNFPKENPGEAIANAVREVIKKEKRQSCLLANQDRITTLRIQWPKL